MVNVIRKVDAKFRAQDQLVTRILGEEMIESHGIAFAEQVKNAKDAGATKVEIDFSNIENDEISIVDNGCGMEDSELLDDWFLIGNSQKEDNSTMSGGKGIGRLSLFKIGDSFEITTTKNGLTSSFFISKKDLSNKGFTGFNPKIIVTEEGRKSGTQINIRNIDKSISLKKVEKELKNLILDEDELTLEIKYPNSFPKTNFLSSSEVMELIPFSAYFDVDLSNLSTISDISYSFVAKLNGEKVYTNNMFLKKIGKEIESLVRLQGRYLNLGKLHFELNNFYFTNENSNYFPKKLGDRSISDYFLSVYMGVNVYRNGFKIFGHGSNDWLKLAEKRVGSPGKNIDNKLSYGKIILDDERSKSLREKSSREGFIKDDTSDAFEEFIILLVKQFGDDRFKGVKALKRRINEKNSNKNVPSNSSFQSKKDVTKESDVLKEKDSSKESKSSNGDCSKKYGEGEKENNLDILKIHDKSIEEGDNLYLKDPDIVNSKFLENIEVINEHNGGLIINNYMVSESSRPGKYKIKYISNKKVEHLILDIRKRKVIYGGKEGFFERSNAFVGEIDLSNIHPIVEQLRGLDYSKKYLLYTVSFRVILEAFIKDYINLRNGLCLSGSLKENVLKVIDDLLEVVKMNGKNDNLKEEKNKIYKKFKGYSALKNFLTTTRIKFSSKNYDQIFNSLTHSPTKLEKNLSLELVNEMILPLYVLIEKLKSEKIV